ncbi:MAG: hypothetical protein AB7I30_00480 [Isosphaeraceae bacterium]
MRLVRCVPATVAATVAALSWPGPTMGLDRDTATLKIKSVKVRATKPGGASWDVGGGAPDLRVSIQKKSRHAGEKFISQVKPDTFEATYEVETLRVEDGDTIEVLVVDEDAVNHDLVGKVSKKITGEMIRAGEAEWSFGEVLSMRIAFVD